MRVNRVFTCSLFLLIQYFTQFYGQCSSWRRIEWITEPHQKLADLKNNFVFDKKRPRRIVVPQFFHAVVSFNFLLFHFRKFWIYLRKNAHRFHIFEWTIAKLIIVKNICLVNRHCLQNKKSIQYENLNQIISKQHKLKYLSTLSK